MRDIKGHLAYFTTFCLVTCACFHLYTALFGVFNTLLQRSIHLAFLLPLCFIYYPATGRSDQSKPTAMDWVLAFAALSTELFVIFDYERVYLRMEHFTPLLTQEIIFGSIAVITVLEGTRRCVSQVLAGITVVSVIYMIFGHLPVFGFLQHPPIQFQRVIEQLFLLGEQGIHGVVVGVSATYVFLFILFGSFLIYTDVGNYIIDLASSLFGQTDGGAAKVAVASSCLFGSISGSGPANVYATGSFTIPLMKRLGYSPSFSAAVESASSTGGQYMPPVMGAVGFIIAETTGISYFEVCKQATISALLFYFAIFMVVDLEAKRLNLKRIPKEELKNTQYLISRFYFVIPILVILIMIVLHYTPFLAAFAGICSAFALSFLNKETRMVPSRLIKTLAHGSLNAIMIALACSCVGIVAAAVIYTGLGQTMTSLIISMASTSIYVAPVLTMLICIALGMGVPCVPAYVVTAVITLPILTKLGFTGLGPHLFILYYAVIASVTPPVAVTAYAAASIALAPPMETSIKAAKVAFVGFIIPFLFLFNDALLMQGSLKEILWALLLAVIIVILGSIGIIGYFRDKVSRWARGACFATCIVCMFLLVK